MIVTFVSMFLFERLQHFLYLAIYLLFYTACGAVSPDPSQTPLLHHAFASFERQQQREGAAQPVSADAG